jgi:hypothetical protein
MDRDDAEQEGITLPPLSTTRMIAREEANAIILQHLRLCPFAVEDIGKRLRSMELGFSKLLGFMLGSGILGGAAGAAVSKLWPK